MLERNVSQVYPASDRVAGSLHMAHTERRDAPGMPDFSLLKRLARDQLIFLLEQVPWPYTVSSEKHFAFWIRIVNLNIHVLQLPGKKDLFIDADLMSPLDRIANVTILKVWNHVIHFRRKYWHAVYLNDQHFISSLNIINIQMWIHTLMILHLISATWSRQTVQSWAQANCQQFGPVSKLVRFYQFKTPISL